jgi:predicted phosphodiesterase
MSGNSEQNKYIIVSFCNSSKSAGNTTDLSVTNIRLWKSDVISDGLPSYWEDLLKTKSSDVLAKKQEIGWNNLHFIVFSDYHWEYNAHDLGKIIRKLMDYDGCKMVVNNGDLVTIQDANLNDDGVPDIAKLDSLLRLREAQEDLKEIKGNLFNVVGNHDWMNYYKTTASDYTHPERFTGDDLISSLHDENRILLAGMSDAGSYYVEDVNKKVRYIFFGVGYNTAYTTNELGWFFDTLDTTPDGFSVLVFMHALITYNVTPQDRPYYNDDASPVFNPQGTFAAGDRFSRIIKALDAFKQNADVSLGTDWAPSQEYIKTYTWSNYNRKLIGVICGHTHYDVRTYVKMDAGTIVYSDDKDSYNFPIVCITGDLYQNIYGYVSERDRRPISKNEYNNSVKIERGDTAQCTVREHAFDDVVVDLDSNKMFFYRIGAGEDVTVVF